MSIFQPKKKSINTPGIGKKSPAQYIGVILSNFSISHYLFIPPSGSGSIESLNDLRKNVKSIRTKLYERIINQLSDLISLSDQEEGVRTTYYFEEYEDYWLRFNNKPDRQRWVLRIVRITPRNTIISTLCRFYTSDTNIYIGIDSYFLGKIRVLSIVFHSLLLLFFLPSFLLGSLGVIGAFLFSPKSAEFTITFAWGILNLLTGGPYLYFSWFPVVKALLDGESFMAALKSRFHDKMFRNIFDEDDVLTYLRSVLPLTLEQLTVVLKEHGIDNEDVFKKLDELIEVTKNKEMTFNNSGSIFGLQLGNNNIQKNG